MRTKRMEKKYLKFKTDGHLSNGCNLCDKKKAETIKEFKYWRIVNNIFPWDRIARINHLIISKRHIVYEKLNKQEKIELDKLKSKYINKKYEIIAETTNRKKSIPEHFHLHLIIPKE
jgi:hypothetical protein